jgi:hypothetical protein
MKRVLAKFAMGAMLVAALAFTASVAWADTWTGWISDSNCGAKGANAGHKECAIKCVKGGAKYVFVNSDNSVVAIENQDAVTESDLGHEVTVTGTKGDDGSIHVESVAEAKKM